MCLIFSYCIVRFLFGDRETNKKQFFREKVVLRFDRQSVKSDQKASFHREICEKMGANRGGCRLAILELFSGFSELLRIARVLTDMRCSL